MSGRIRTALCECGSGAPFERGTLVRLVRLVVAMRETGSTAEVVALLRAADAAGLSVKDVADTLEEVER